MILRSTRLVRLHKFQCPYQLDRVLKVTNPARNAIHSLFPTTRNFSNSHFHHRDAPIQPHSRSSTTEPTASIPSILPPDPTASYAAWPPSQPPPHPPSNSLPQSFPTPPPRPPQKRPRSLRPLIYATTFLFLGLGLGTFARAIVLPPPLPIPDSVEDEFYLSKIRKDLNQLPLVQELRKNKEEWKEYDAYTTINPETAGRSMTAGALRGSKGIGLQRIFYNASEKRIISVVFLGGGIAGWPGVTHGGALATLLQEGMERAVGGLDWERDVFKDIGRGVGLRGFTLKYKKPTRANSMVVVRAQMEEEIGNGTVKVLATLEDAASGLITVEAEGECLKA